MVTIDALEAQVTERKEQAQLLMQAVLREACAPGMARVAQTTYDQLWWLIVDLEVKVLYGP